MNIALDPAAWSRILTELRDSDLFESGPFDRTSSPSSIKGVVNSLVASAPPQPSAEDVVEIKQEVPASPATVVKPKEGRLARAAAAKKRKAEAAE